MLKHGFHVIVFLALALPTALLAQETIPQPIALPEVDPLILGGDLTTAGSSTVYPLTAALVEQFIYEGFMGNITVDSIGSGAGFDRFCVAGETDIANASRAITSSEIESCREIGREPVEFRVGTDALVVVVSARNDFVQDLTEEQIALIFTGEASTWADIDPAWPAQPIQLFSPGTDSGTFDYFVEHIFEGVRELEEEAAVSAILNAPGLQLSEDDNVLVQGVAGSPYAIGYFGYAFYRENAGALRAVTVNGVTPNEETTETGEYPLARPLFIYSDAGIMTEKSQVADFINYYLSNVNTIILEVGYFSASTAALNESKANWLIAMGREEDVPQDVLETLQAR